jgi:hypothetical protein
MKCKTFSFHSYRRFVKSVISDQVSQDYSEWYLAHAGRSVYYQQKEPKRREIFSTKCMKYLTFLDYSTLENSGRSIVAKLEEKDKEIDYLRQRDLKREKEFEQLAAEIREIKKVINSD